MGGKPSVPDDSEETLQVLSAISGRDRGDQPLCAIEDVSHTELRRLLKLVQPNFLQMVKSDNAIQF